MEVFESYSTCNEACRNTCTRSRDRVRLASVGSAAIALLNGVAEGIHEVGDSVGDARALSLQHLSLFRIVNDPEGERHVLLRVQLVPQFTHF